MHKPGFIIAAVFLALTITSCGKPEAVVEVVKKRALKISPKPLEPLTLQELQKGVVYTSWSDSELGSPDSDATLVYLEKIGVRHVAIMIPTYQNGPTNGRIVAHDFAGGGYADG